MKYSVASGRFTHGTETHNGMAESGSARVRSRLCSVFRQLLPCDEHCGPDPPHLAGGVDRVCTDPPPVEGVDDALLDES